MDQPALIRRRDAAQATLERYRDKPFKWGVRDCSRMVASHLRLLGYTVRLPPSGSYGTLLGATRALKKAGFGTVAEAIDSIGLVRIPPAEAIVGDIVAMPGVDCLGGFGVALGNGRLVAYHEDAAGAAVIQATEFLSAWRAEPA